MDKVAWLQLRTDAWELRRAYPMAHFDRMRANGESVTVALATAADAVLFGKRALTGRWRGWE
eukprot:scaffold266554_cov23-Tisochrysis_lutea.AAC.3